MSAIAFGIPVQFDKAYVEGITKLSATDIRYAEQLGYRIKLLGITKRTPIGVELRVHPSLVPSKRLIANVEGAMNAVVVQGDAVGTTLYYGKGAGSEPTASAVIADLVDITRLHTVDPLNRVPHLAFQPHTLDQAMTDLPVLPMSDVVTSYYLRLRVADEAGVLAKVTGIVANAGISIDALLQREADEVGGEGATSTDLIILTHDTREGTMDAVLADAGLAHGAGADRAHPQGRAELMLYISTRGDKTGRKHFCEILLEGLAPDGGLYLPEAYPQVDAATLHALARILTPAGYADAGLRDPVALHRRHSRPTTCAPVREDLHRGVFGTDEIVPLRRAGGGFYLEALSNGPTLAFKDMAMQLLGNLFEYELGAAASSSTSWAPPAATPAARPSTRCAARRACASSCCRPHGRMSPFQQAQMFSLQDANIHNIAIEGVFDDCQDIVKAVSNDLDFKRSTRSAPSTRSTGRGCWPRWCTTLPATSRPRKSNDAEGQLPVPSGNFGNVCAGHVARMMGLPSTSWWWPPTRTTCSTSSSAPARYRVRGSAETHETSSPSMDISKASNFERFVFDLLGRDGAARARRCSARR
jgi:threonine synthase